MTGTDSTHRTRIAALFTAAVLASAAACSDDAISTSQAAATGSTPSTEPSGTAQDITELDGPGPGEDLGPGTYSIDPDADPSTPMRVEYELPGAGRPGSERSRTTTPPTRS